MEPQLLRTLWLDGTILLDHGLLTFLSAHGEPLQEPLLKHFAVITPDIADLTPLHEAVVTHQRRMELCIWMAILEGQTLRLRGFIQSCHLEYATGISGRLSIETFPI